MTEALSDSFERDALKIEEGLSAGESDSGVEAVLRKYSDDRSNKARFLELACLSLDKIESSTSAKFYLMRQRVACPVGSGFEESLCRDLLVKCRLLIDIRMFLLVLEKRQNEGLEHYFQYQQTLFARFKAKLGACLAAFESKERIGQMEAILARVLSREAGWADWKERKCEGNIHLAPEAPSGAKTRFSELEMEDVRVKMKTLKEAGVVRKYIFKRASEKKENEKMKNWISLQENHDLLNSLETEDLWMDQERIGMEFRVMAQECLGGDSLAHVKTEVEEYEAGRARDGVDEFVKWRFTNRLVKRSYESMVGDHERDLCRFIAKNADCFKNRSINEKILKMRYSKEGVLLRQRNQMMRDSLRSKGSGNGRRRRGLGALGRGAGGGGALEDEGRGRNQEAEAVPRLLQRRAGEAGVGVDDARDPAQDNGGEGSHTEDAGATRGREERVGERRQGEGQGQVGAEAEEREQRGQGAGSGVGGERQRRG